MCYKILNSEVSLNCMFFNLSALTYSLREDTSINCISNSPVSMHINIFSVIEFVTFGILLPDFAFDLSS